MATTISKGRDGWDAETVIDLETKNRVLIITTHKVNGGVANRATVNTKKDGFLSWDLFGDFSKRTVFKGTRCTEKTVRALHQQALDAVEQIKAEAAAFYQVKDAKEVVSA
mgnify:CR=1 FL=1